MIEESDLNKILSVIEENRYGIDMFRHSVAYFFDKHPRLNSNPPIIHSVKSRLKDSQHIRNKIIRKYDLKDPITPDKAV